MISAKMLEELSFKVSLRLSEKRFSHTVGVRKMAAYLGKMCLPDSVSELEAAALLHDITKEISDFEEKELLGKTSVDFPPEDYPAVIHSITAPVVISRDFPELATEQILSAVKKHTLGSADMSVFDMIIFISDYIEEGRRYESCIQTRDFLLNSLCDGEYSENIKALRAACLMAIDFTVENLKEKKRPVNPITLAAKNTLFSEN